MTYLTPDDQRDLLSYFSGALAADMGIRSSLGPQLDRMAAGITADGNCLVDITPGERACGAVVTIRRIERTLAALPPEQARTLRAYYAPRPLGLLDGLETFGTVVGIILETHTRADLRATIKASRKPINDPAGRDARLCIHTLIGAAQSRLRAAQASYASAAQQLRTERRRHAA